MMHYQEIMLQVMKKIAENTGRIADSLEKQNEPAIELEKRGKWEKVADLCGVEVLKCSVCGVERPRTKTKYCCDCGSKMTKEE